LLFFLMMQNLSYWLIQCVQKSYSHLKSLFDLAVIALNRMGTEGENSRSEGGETYNFNDAPKQIFDTLNRYRICRVGGKVYENKKK